MTDAPSASAGEFAAVTVPPEAGGAKIGGKLRSFSSSNYRSGMRLAYTWR